MPLRQKIILDTRDRLASSELMATILIEELLTLIQGVLLLGRLYQKAERQKVGFEQVRRHLREALR